MSVEDRKSRPAVPEVSVKIDIVRPQVTEHMSALFEAEQLGLEAEINKALSPERVKALVIQRVEQEVRNQIAQRIMVDVRGRLEFMELNYDAEDVFLTATRQFLDTIASSISGDSK